VIDINSENIDPIVYDGKYNPIRIHVNYPDFIEKAKIFAREYEKLSGQTATVIQEYSTKIPNEQKISLPEVLSYSPEQLQLGTNEIKIYTLNENEKLYLFSKENEVRGILRYTTPNVKNLSARLEQLVQSVKANSNSIDYKKGRYIHGTVPEELDSSESIFDLVVNSSTKRQAHDLGELVIIADHHKNNSLEIEQEQLASHLIGDDYNNMTDKVFIIAGVPTVVACATSLVTPIALVNYCGGVLTIGMGIAGAVASILSGFKFASFLTNRWDKTPIVLNPELLTEQIQKHQTDLKELKKELENANSFDKSMSISKKLSKTNELNKLYFESLKNAATRKAVSLTYIQTYNSEYISPENLKSRTDAEEKVLNFFRKILGEKTIPAPEAAVLAVQQENNKLPELTPEPAFDKIRIEQDWKQDTKYDTIIDGRYKLKELIGEGGMGKVYRAVSLFDEKEYAIKFENETNALSKKQSLIKTIKGIKHDNLISLVDANFNASNVYTVMEFIDGVDLGKIIAFAKTKNKRAKQKKYLRLENILNIAEDVGNALAYLHSNEEHKKIIHNDVKDGNVMIDRKGKAYIGDCDVADIQADLSSILTGLTAQKASGAGTLDRMAPERRNANARIDERSDIYSFGVMIYEMITGQLPMTPNGLNARKDLPKELIDFVCKCVEVDPKDRYSSMNEAMEILNKIPIERKKISMIIHGKEEQSHEELQQEEQIAERPDISAPELQKEEKPAELELPVEAIQTELEQDSTAEEKPAVQNQEETENYSEENEAKECESENSEELPERMLE